MRLFLYYTVHTTINQLRKLLRTWVFFMFLGFITAGGLIGYVISWYYQRLKAIDTVLPENISEFLEASNITALNAVELAAGLVVLGILVIQIIGAELSFSRLFFQADVNLLFASDMTPQSVLGFRVMTTIGTAIAAAIFMGISLPSMAKRFSLSPYAAFSVLAAWCLTLGFSVLFKILLYESGSIHHFLRRNLRWFIILILSAICFSFYIFYKRSGDQNFLLSAHRFFNSPLTRFIPVWGWVKGALLFALEGNISMSLCLTLLSTFSILLLIIAARHMKADYYEDTLNRAEQLSRFLDALNDGNVALLVTAPGQVKKTVNRDGFHYGEGASVYFYKVLYNRFRFSRFGLVTKTSVTYLIAAVGAGLFDRIFIDEPISYIPVLMLAVMVFFRTIISPVTEDIRKASFLIQPDSIWKKLFFSLLGGSTSCAIDVFVPLIAGSAAAGFNPLMGIMYLPALVTVDFFATAVGTFVDVSIPASIGSTIKQVLQVILLYVGLIFDGMMLINGIVTGHDLIGFAFVAVVNIVLGLTFLGLAGVWLHPNRGLSPKTPGFVPKNKEANAAYSYMGFALTFMFLAIHISQPLLAEMLPDHPLLSLYLPIYGIGFGVFMLLIRCWRHFMPTAAVSAAEKELSPDGNKLPIKRFLILVPVCFFVMYSGNVLGLILQGIIHILIPFSLPLPETAALTIEELPSQALFLAVASPLMEEFIFRRIVIDRLSPYGEKAALFMSALLFGLFHGSLNQLCYAFLLGLVFGYVYIKTKKLRYTIILHMGINSLSTVLLPMLLAVAESAMPDVPLYTVPISSVLTNPGVMGLIVYMILIILLSLLGAVLFFFGVRQRQIEADTVTARTVFSAAGIVTFIVISLIWLV